MRADLRRPGHLLMRLVRRHILYGFANGTEAGRIQGCDPPNVGYDRPMTFGGTRPWFRPTVLIYYVLSYLINPVWVDIASVAPPLKPR